MLRQLIDLAKQASLKNSGVDSDFLTPEEYSSFLENRKQFHFVENKVYKEDWERKLIHFGLGEAEISILHIRSKSGRFVKLKHPDYLGALIGLGLDRKVLGDIIAFEEEAFVYVKSTMEDFLLHHLKEVGRASVEVETIEEIPQDKLPKSQVEEVVLSSLRIDRFLASVFHLARKKSQEAIQEGLVFIDGLSITKIHTDVEENQRISLRKKGKVRLLKILRKTKKGSLVIQIERYL